MENSKYHKIGLFYLNVKDDYLKSFGTAFTDYTLDFALNLDPLEAQPVELDKVEQ